MSRQPPSSGLREIHLSEVPVAIRVAEAQALIKAARLGFLDALVLGAAAEAPIDDPVLEVPEWKIERVLAGKRVLGSVPKELT